MFARAAAPAARAVGRRFISVGDAVPVASATQGLFVVRDGAASETTAEELFKGRNVVVFGLPGAFTPVCSASHLPGYIADREKFAAHGIDDVLCITPNDKFVATAWAKDQGAGDKVGVVADGNLVLTKALDQAFDMKDVGFGERSNRYAMVIRDGKVDQIFAEPNPGTFEVSDSASVLSAIERK
ncbi:hypothetical protein FNF27_00135 [Cafeteria roenbergensis]|uniref:Thioredoxin domain-containing protein n=1 Tax=Cafeteria roenbergensis TaxID=33653 RepID=A0A5A8DFW9_CAFRO|nr:hypothetical protein FNF29_01264 [Cafeteria roenbergensis]KAA0164235.1 hypothetical protein FNF31_02471 [Cafeteria roenbergensis]KAA0165003.1 hypothetical protein FNF28_03626 [Cafeteria roenbergensis]KAA0178282.1 hypothetical protein FNF27_00135 [Cafeteria roenbergensis]|eukprot:KAA0155844.1 hypothetical protein FNF29_01264 [Cafeteria roenbergensis]